MQCSIRAVGTVGYISWSEGEWPKKCKSAWNSTENILWTAVKICLSKILGCATRALPCSLYISQSTVRSCSSPDAEIAIIPHKDFRILKEKNTLIASFTAEPSSSDNNLCLRRRERAQSGDPVLLHSSVGRTHGEKLHSALCSCLMYSWWLQWHVKAKFIYPNLWHVFAVCR